MEWPEKGMADKGPSSGTGVPSLVITGDSPGPCCTHYGREKDMQIMEETKTYLQDWPSTTKRLIDPILEIHNPLKGTDLSRTAHFSGKFL